ncbi:DUF4920 domain-containing protein [Marinihelvus fidelis]|uniref:DUF4920 domain-containing protein n=2 Tax=Marinihelvus fidelis TaxID=2613842 RepID=A0A5N0TFF0_9GAMM|nr:DUF4920 domain-containing protein [Marinihelvus fidelis]
MGDVTRLSAPVESTAEYEVFGDAMTDKAPGLSVSEAVASLGDNGPESVRVTTTINKVCQKKGCFFIAQEGDTVVRVTFHDYAFFIPTDTAGKPVTLVGELVRTPISQAQADHYADDLGEAPEPIAGAFEYAIEASSVLIQR